MQRDDLVTFQIHYQFAATGEKLVSTGELRFRTRETLTNMLEKTGFSIDQVYGDWNRRAATPTDPELIFVAIRE